MILCGIAACATEDPKDKLMNQLNGRWEIQEASRNGRITESLDKLYFDFGSGGALATNLSGATEKGTYEIKASQILQRGMQIDVTYDIASISDSLLVLTAEIRNNNFKFELVPDDQEE